MVTVNIRRIIALLRIGPEVITTTMIKSILTELQLFVTNVTVLTITLEIACRETSEGVVSRKF